MTRMPIPLVLIAAAWLLAGCGFQLRGYDLQSEVTSFAIVGQERARVVNPLRRSLRQAGVEEVAATQAVVIVHIQDQRFERRNASTGSGTRATEYELTVGVQFALRNSAGESLAPARWIERQRVFRIDRDNIVGAAEEQAIIERELVQDVVGQIIRAMDTVSRVERSSANAG